MKEIDENCSKIYGCHCRLYKILFIMFEYLRNKNTMWNCQIYILDFIDRQ